VYDMLGREVAAPVQARQPAGLHRVPLTLPPGLPSGPYVYHITAGRFSDAGIMTLLR
jgi:hypothetical protein